MEKANNNNRFKNFLIPKKGARIMPRRGGRHFVVLSGAEKVMEAFKEEIAEDLGLGNKIRDNGWKGLTTQEVGSVGGEMVKRIIVAGEYTVLDRFNAGVKLSPQMPEGTVVNNADPHRKIIETRGETAAMAKYVNQTSLPPQ